MTPRRLLLALTLALAWCWGAWHDDLEGAGLLFDHRHHAEEHHHGDHDSSHRHSTPAEGDDHAPVWARGHLPNSHSLAALLVWFAAIALIGGGLLGGNLRPSAAPLALVPRRRPPDLRPAWLFEWRCAPDAVAPSALS